MKSANWLPPTLADPAQVPPTALLTHQDMEIAFIAAFGATGSKTAIASREIKVNDFDSSL
jgi:hypothetical protein